MLMYLMEDLHLPVKIQTSEQETVSSYLYIFL